MFRQELHLKQLQKLSPQQIQLMKLVELPTVALEERIEQELEENPALESGAEEDFPEEKDEFDNSEEDFNDSEVIDTEDINIDEYLSDDEIPEYRLRANNYSEEQEVMPYRAEVSFHQSLVNQLGNFRLNDIQREVAEFLIGSLDDDGYLRRGVENISDDLAFTQNLNVSAKEIEKIRQDIILQLDPVGVGACNLQECLLIQLQRKTLTKNTELAILILTENFDAFSKKHYHKLVSRYNISEKELQQIIHEIEKLNPKPGSAYSEGVHTEQVTPDFFICIIDGKLELSLNNGNTPELHVSREYTQMLETYRDSKDKASQREAVLFIKQKLDSAKWFVDAIKQRQRTLYTTMHAIMMHQQEYFLTGEETQLRPLVLRDIAPIVNLDVSTVSRVVANKYVNTPYGTKLIKEFFSESLKNDEGEDISTLEIKSILKTIIDQEDKQNPIPDEKLVEILKEKGYNVARRTINKYREQLDIPVARMRRKIIV